MKHLLYTLFPVVCMVLSLMIPSYAKAKVATSEPEIKNYGLIDPPPCTLDSGENIKIYPGTSEQVVSFGGFLAAAGDFEVGKDGGIVNEVRIYYDQSNMPFLHPLLQEFLFRHECAHVKLSHLDIPHSQRLGNYWNIEQGADCQALEELSKIKSDFGNKSELILTHFAFISNAMLSNAPGNADKRKAFITKRIENMRLCPALKN